MATRSVIREDRHYTGAITFGGTVDLPASTVVDGDVSASAAIAATKVIHQLPIHYNQANGTDVTTETRCVHICRGTATIVSVDVVSPTSPTGGDKKYTVDVHWGNQATAYATILSSVVDYTDAATADRQVLAGTLSVTSLADGDSLLVIVTASGSTGSQAQGLNVTIMLREEPD